MLELVKNDTGKKSKKYRDIALFRDIGDYKQFDLIIKLLIIKHVVMCGITVN